MEAETGRHPQTVGQRRKDRHDDREPKQADRWTYYRRIGRQPHFQQRDCLKTKRRDKCRKEDQTEEIDPPPGHAETPPSVPLFVVGCLVQRTSPLASVSLQLIGVEEGIRSSDFHPNFSLRPPSLGITGQQKMTTDERVIRFVRRPRIY